MCSAVRSARILYIAGLIVSYSLCSSMLLILNKVRLANDMSRPHLARV